MLTGTLPGKTRAEAKALIESLGGRGSRSVSQKTALLSAGEAGGAPLERARSLGVRVVGPAELERIVNAGALE